MCLMGLGHFSGVLLRVVLSTVEGYDLGGRGHSDKLGRGTAMSVQGNRDKNALESGSG